MARIPDAEIERLKAEISLVRLVEASGVKLAKRGGDMVANCPFHDDDTPSLVVTVAKNLFHCFGCDVGGGPIDWVMKREGVSFRHAIELLRDGAALDPPASSSSPVRGTVRRLAPPVSMDADDAALLAQVIGYYHDTLKQSPEALAYLASRGLSHPDLIATFRLGYADRSLGLRLPEKTRKAGADIRAKLEQVGLYRASGHEHFTGSLVVPVIDAQGVVTEVYGRKIRNNLRAGTRKHLYLPGPHRGSVGHRSTGCWQVRGHEGAPDRPPLRGPHHGAEGHAPARGGRSGADLAPDATLERLRVAVAGLGAILAEIAVRGGTAPGTCLEALRSVAVTRDLFAYSPYVVVGRRGL